ncbi:GntR family transcriptional regulator [Sporosarcina oncorhynchi]|uniref:GntR family transcriptional regulator n=1 Tax=Sporosarcina oncorhynchi TaxID=3056444 RepID=A0ABZ0L8Y4_9BACL|nr:GntR family transcriptional regulator [Sporosarcina sp. T2O-4]WOV88634.1 GntR family transcriptional regulator [Sporosarcina sp. T2O-4]
MFIEIETTSDIPIYTQLVNQLIGLIAAGILKPNEPLPSVRSLAADLGVNMHTVNKAYHELERKNILKIIPKSGAVVNDLKIPTEQQISTITQLLKPIIAESIVYGMQEEEIVSLASLLFSEYKEG